MNNLVLDSILIMLICFVLGAAAAWLLAAAMYPTRRDLRQAPRDGRGSR